MGGARALACGVALLGALLAAAPLAQPGFYAGHDNVLNVHRLVELEKCLADGQLPCRWVPTMGAGNGLPLFNYYPPLSSHVAAGFRMFGIGYGGAVKATFALALVLAALGAAWLGVTLWGVIPGILAGLLFVWAPYFAVDVYVRGALSETLALGLLPWLLITARATVLGGSPSARAGASLGVALTGGSLLLAHQLVALTAVPLYAVWCGVLVGELEAGARRTRLPRFALAHLVGLGLAAFFWLPAALELGEVHRQVLIDLYPWSRFENNFIAARELWLGTAAWGYGALGTDSPMKLSLGWLQSALALAALALGLRKGLPRPRTAVALVGAGLFCAAMVMPISRPLWESTPLLAFLQFPWRFLGVVHLCFAVAGAAVFSALDLRFGSLRAAAGAAALTALLLGLHFENFRPERMAIPDEVVLFSDLQIVRTRHGLFDFLPVGVDLERFPEKPPGAVPRPLRVLEPQGLRARSLEHGTDWLRFQIDAPSPALIRFASYRFPGWTARIDGVEASFDAVPDALARLHLRVPEGQHAIELRFEDTGPRRLGNAISALALLSCPALLLPAVLDRVRKRGRSSS